MTGGASGIGKAVADSFLDDGAAVTIFDRRRSTDPRVKSVLGDVRVYEDNERAVGTAAIDGRLDVLIVNAGIHDGGLRLLDTQPHHLEETFRRVIDVDVVGYLLAARAAADSLIAASGCVVLTLSDAAFDVRSNNAGIAYLTAKHACVGLVHGLARDLAPAVRVNGVAPSGVPTSLVAADGDRDERPAITDAARLRSAVASRTLLNRAIELEDVVSAFRFLCGPGAASITGQILRTDGGLIP
ncbi:hypothetical protein BCD49_28570 [Pseudofrankia sp. EUN1h]|nr:hypothetical protein BCD49_28570 [Pseudofrankia sp. EUN1h]